MTAIVVPVPPSYNADVDVLAPFYEYSNRPCEQTRFYLSMRPELIALLLEARPIITRYFGEAASAILEVMTYPEGGASGPLIVWIATTASVSESMTQEERFDEEWWLDHTSLAASDLVFNLRYK